jgi:hypothetical protein
MKNALETKTTAMTPDERAFIDRFVADYCRPHESVVAARLEAFAAARQVQFLSHGVGVFALAAGPSVPGREVQAPEEEVRFTFASDGEVDAEGAWRAELVVPPRAGPETMLSLKVVDGFGEVVDGGVFTLSGTALPLVGGRAEMPFGLFLAGIRNTEVSLRRAGEGPVGGRLLFF